jgi:hypothetical protein
LTTTPTLGGLRKRGARKGLKILTGSEAFSVYDMTRRGQAGMGPFVARVQRSDLSALADLIRDFTPGEDRS